MHQVKDYEFLVKLDRPEGVDLLTDEPPPLGKDAGPSPTRLLAASLGSCLSGSLLFASRKAGVAMTNIRTNVKVQIVRNDKRRMRVGKVIVEIDPGLSPEDSAKAKGAREVFEDFCTVTQSVRNGIEIDVKVKGIDG